MSYKNAKDFGPSEWLELLMACQNGEATCMRVMEFIDQQTVPMSCVTELNAFMRDLCYEIERLPAGDQQTNLSIHASAIAQELQRLTAYAAMTPSQPSPAQPATAKQEGE